MFAEHGIAGIIGLLFNGLFGADYVIGLDGVNTGIIPGGWLNRNWRQLYVQLAYIVAAVAYAFVMSYLIASAVNYMPGLKLRASDEAELLGMDDDQLGEFAYDYVEVRRDYLAWTPAQTEPRGGGVDIPMSRRHGIPEHGLMLEGKRPSSSTGTRTGEEEGEVVVGGDAHVGIGGDRHGIAVEKMGGKHGLGGGR